MVDDGVEERHEDGVHGGAQVVGAGSGRGLRMNECVAKMKNTNDNERPK